MDVIREILDRIGISSIEAMELNQRYTIIVPGFEDLTIEKVGSTRVSVAHHYLQRGDLMCDPEIVFMVEDTDWTPVRYTQHPRIHQYDREGLELDAFIRKWSQNLRRQGFVEAAENLSINSE